MSYKFSRDIGYQPWGITNPWVFANYGQPQRQRGYVSPMIFQTHEPLLRQPNLGGLGMAMPLMVAARTAAVRMAPAKMVAARTAAAHVAAAPAAVRTFAAKMAATPAMVAARTAVAHMAASAAPFAVQARMKAARMAANPQQAARYMAAAHRAAAQNADSPRVRAAHTMAARMAADASTDPDMAAMHIAALCGLGADAPTTSTAPVDTATVTAQSVLDEELARSRRMEIVSVASLALGVASYMLFRRAMKKNPGARRGRRHRSHS